MISCRLDRAGQVARLEIYVSDLAAITEADVARVCGMLHGALTKTGGAESDSMRSDTANVPIEPLPENDTGRPKR